MANMTVTDSGGNTSQGVFVSGIPDQQLPRFNNGQVNLPPNTNPAVANAAAGGINGNWTHAEMHAMNHVLNNVPPGSKVSIEIDRPPCTRNVGGKGGCNAGLAALIAEAEAKGIEVEVTYLDKEGNRKPYPPC
jgi:hypothetical protein